MASAEEAKRRGNEHFVRGEFDDAIAAYTEALVHNPGMREAYCNRSGAKLQAPTISKARRVGRRVRNRAGRDVRARVPQTRRRETRVRARERRFGGLRRG